MKRIRELLEKKWFAYTFATCSAVFLYWVLSHLGSFLTGLGIFFGYLRPVFFGLVIAYILNPIVHFFEDRLLAGVKRVSLRRSLSILCTVLTVGIVITVLLIALIPQIVDSVATLFSNMNIYTANLQNILNNLYAQVSNLSINLDLTQFMETATDSLMGILRSLPSRIGDIMSTSVSIGTGFASFVISCILAIYYLADKERLKKGFSRLMKALMAEKDYNNYHDFWSRCNTILIRYIGGDLLDGILVGIVNYVFMLIMGMPFGVLISVIVGVTNLAPTFGPIVGAIIGAFILVLVNPWHALWFLIFTIILQTLDGYVIKPKLFGSALGVSSVAILIALIVGGRIFGVIGILLAIPAAAIFDYVYTDLVIRRIEAHRMDVDTVRRYKGLD